MKRALALLLCLLLAPAALAEQYVVDYYLDTDSFYVNYSILLGDDGSAVLGTDDCSFVTELTDRFSPEADRRYAVGSTSDFYEDEDGYRSPLVAMAGCDGKPITGYDYANLMALESGDIAYWKPDGEAGLLRPDGAEFPLGPYGTICPFAGGWLCAEATDSFFIPGAVIHVAADGTVTDTGLHTINITLLETDSDPCVLEDVPELGDYDVLLGTDLKPCFDSVYSNISSSGGNALVFDMSTGSYGLLDYAGNVLLPVEFDKIVDFTDGDGKPAYLAVDGDELGFAVYDGERFEARCEVSLRDIPDVQSAAIYVESDALVSATLYGTNEDDALDVLIYDADGRLQPDIPLPTISDYYSASTGEPQRRVVTDPEGDAPCYLVDLEGKRASGRFQELEGDLWKDGHGRYKLVTYDYTTDEDGDVRADWRTSRYGAIDEDGRVLVEPIYDNLFALDLDRYWVTLGTRTGLVDAAGNWYFAVDTYDFLMD